MPTYDYECPNCAERFEDREEIATRNNKHECPVCCTRSPRIPSLVRFNTVFPGSERAESHNKSLEQLTAEAMSEGFTSRDEIETAKGLAAERAKQLGYDKDKQLIGPVKSPYVGDAPVADANILQTKDRLARTAVQAARTGRVGVAEKAKRELAAVERHSAAEAKKVKREFRPDATPTVLKSRIKDAQSRRGPGYV